MRHNLRIWITTWRRSLMTDYQRTSEKDLETSSEASIDQHHPPDINRYPPDCIDRHPPDNIDRHPGLDELSGYIVEEEPIEERMYMSKSSHLVVPKHQRPPIWTEEAAGFHKRVKRIHDIVKIVVPCAVFEVESPIPPDRSMHISSYIEVLDDHQHVEASQRGLRFRDEVDKGPSEAASIDTDRILSNDTTDAISNNINNPTSIDVATSPSLDTGRVSEQKEFDVCGKGPKEVLNGVKKSKVRSRCFSKPFARVRALLIAERIDKGEESMEEAFTQE
ncbi:hypothetical protein YC2023_015965 [Brassica napus]